MEIKIQPRPSAGIRGGQQRSWMQKKAPQTVGPAFLANELEVVEFRPDGRTVVVSYKRLNEKMERVTISIDHARAEYRRLLNAGYTKW